MKKIVFFSLLPILLLAKFQVTTYFPLETYIAKYIGKNEIRVKQINNRYLPSKRKISSFDISKLADVKLYMHLGLGVEKEYESIFKKSNPFIKTLDLSKDIKIVNNNPYYWLDPFNLRIVAKSVYNKFCEIDKFSCSFYKQNYESFLNEIDSTFLNIKNKLMESDVRSLYTLGNYWDYFGKRFRIILVDKEKKYIKLDELHKFIEETKNRRINKIIYLKGDSYSLASSISNSLKIELIEHDPFEEKIFFSLRLLAQEISK